MKYEFSKMQLKDIEGKVVPTQELYKTVANALWLGAKNLDLVDIAMKINKGEPVELSKTEVVEIERVVKNPKSGIFAFAQHQILQFIEGVKAKESEKKNKKGKK